MSEAARKKSRAATTALVALLFAAAAVLGVFAWKYLINGKSRYPLAYEDLIVSYAREYGLDPYYVAAVINVESGFDPGARSNPGAMGLMQIMPETGEWIAEKLGMEDFSADRLYDPETNISFGCWYLDFLNERFNGSRDLVAAGYNAGHNRVSGWLEDTDVSADGESLTNIPYAETERYVEKVRNAYEKYKEYYEIGQ